MKIKRLVILAAGMGSRYGGLKQMDPIGPHGEFILDYTIRDALAAGFSEVVFVIRRDLEADFRAIVGDRWEARGVPVRYVFQDLDDLPAGFVPPEGRTKPWGTGHAVLAARQWLDAPFAVANADDYYDASAFRALADFLDATYDDDRAYGMVGYPVAGTLSDFGSVSRAVCHLDPGGNLLHIEERLHIERGADGVIRDGDLVLADDTPVCMNLLGFKPSYAKALADSFAAFLQARGTEPKSEFYISLPLQPMLDAGQARVQVLRVGDARWIGVTNREDRPLVQAALADVPPVWPAPAATAAAPRKGFTLVEIIIAMTIVVILGTVVGVLYQNLPQKGRVSAAKMQLAAFKTALELYAADNGFLPTQQQGLAALISPPAQAPVPEHFAEGGYLDSRELPADPWGRPYAYFCPGPEGLPYEIVCYGADGEEGGNGFNADLSTARISTAQP